MLWFDNGLNDRVFDPLKLHLAAHYYNRAAEWKKEVSISTKGGHGGGAAFLAGTITDFERMSRAPAELTDYVWQVDEPVLHRFGYTEDSPIAKAENVIASLVNNVSKNGALLLNISPKADGTIPDDQQQLLLEIGRWLDVNGDAIYGTRPWKKFGEGTLKLERGQRYSGKDVRFTTKGDTLYAIFLAWPEGDALLASLAAEATGAPTGKIESIALLGDGEELDFAHESTGLRVKFPATKPCEHAFALRIAGLKL